MLQELTKERPIHVKDYEMHVDVIRLNVYRLFFKDTCHGF